MSKSYGCNQDVYSSSQAAASAALSLACSVSLAAPAALANNPMPAPPPLPSQTWQSRVSSGPGAGIFRAAWPSQAPISIHTSGSTDSGQRAVKAAGALSHSGIFGLHASVPAGSAGVLNLASSALSYLAGNLANFSSLTIDVGGHQEQVALNTRLTGAEVVAVEQVLATGSQSLQLSSTGAATGGTVSLNANLLSALDNSLGGSISSLTVARGVQVVDSLSVLSLAGSLTNYGSILTASATSGSSDTISAGTILNAASGAIASYGGGGAGSNTMYAANPVLNAVASLTNNGTIGSAGNLTITAPVVSNVAGSSSAAASPTITAAQNVNINTHTLNNAGVVAAVTGNVNVASTAALSVTGTGGILQANSGNINLSSNNADINVNGGNMLCQQVNFNAGTGNISANLDQVTGVVNASGHDVSIIGNTQNLQMGQIDATGDPLIANSSTITLGTDSPGPTSGEDLTIVSGQNIVCGAGATLDTSSTTGAGGNLTLVAGANYTAGTSGSIKVTGPSISGGDIDLTGYTGSNSMITTASNDSKAATGGAIEMVAYTGTALGSTTGLITIPNNVTINASSTAGTYGNVTIISGATTGQAVTTGAIEGRVVTVDTAAPSGSVTFASSGAASGAFTASTTANQANISLGNVDAIQSTNTVGNGLLNIHSSGTVTVSNSAAGGLSTPLTLGTINLGTTGVLTATNAGTGTTSSINVGGVITGDSITIQADGTVTATKSITGTNVEIEGYSASGNAVVIGAPISGDTIELGLYANLNVAGSTAGNIVLNAAVGTKTSTSISIMANSSANEGGQITGVGLVSAVSINLGASDSIGTASKPVVIEAGTETGTATTGIGTLTIAAANSTGGVFVDQRANLLLGASSATDLVLKVTGNLDVTGTVTAPALSLISTGTTTVGGTITNGGTVSSSTAGAIVITSDKTFTIDLSGSITTTNDSGSVTINVTNTGVINGALAVQELNLTTADALTFGTGASLTGGTDNISSKGAILVLGQLNPTTLDMTTTRTITFGASGDSAAVTVADTGSITAQTITILSGAASTGNISYTATASGDSFLNSGTVNGQTVTVTTSSASGVVDNASGGILEATMQPVLTTVPTLNLNTHIIDNTGTIEAFGAAGQTNGLLNIASSGTLKITGTAGGFQTNYFSAVSLMASGAITVGGIVDTTSGGVVSQSNSNPFSSLTAANDLGSFTINTTSTFSSTMTGISVVTNAAGTVGGTISITASSLLYNGTTATLPASPFSLTANGTGAPVGAPISVDLTGSKGLTIGGDLYGDIGVNVFGFGPANTLKFTTTGALTVNTAAIITSTSPNPSLEQAGSSSVSLALTGQTSLLIVGNLFDTASGTNVTLTTKSASQFLVGGPASSTKNGQTGNSAGQGISAYQLNITAAGLVVLEAGTSSSLGAALDGSNGVNIISKGLTINDYANVISAGTGLTVSATTGGLSYINTNAGKGFVISSSLINLFDTAGTLTLGSGTPQTLLIAGANADGSGGTFNINARSLSFGAGGILFDTAYTQDLVQVNGGQVNLNLSGTSSVKVGVGAGNISANVSSSSASDNGVFSLTNGGSIVVTNLYNPPDAPSGPAIQFGASGIGTLILDAAGANAKLSIKDISGIDLNTISLTSHSTTSFVLSDATGGNGIIDPDSATGAAASITASVISISNSGEVNVNNASLSAMQQLALTSNTSINLAQLPTAQVATGPGFVVNSSGAAVGGSISITAPTLNLSDSGLSLTAYGGTASGGSISVTTTTTPVTIGKVGQEILLNVSAPQGNLGGSVRVVSAGNLTVDASAINFGAISYTGASLSLTSGANSPLLLNNANTLTGLQLGTVTLTSGSSSAFFLANAGSNGNASNGIGAYFVAGPATFNAGTVNIKIQGDGVINATMSGAGAFDQLFTVNQLSLSTFGAVNFGPSQIISVAPNGAGNGGTIMVNAGSINISGGLALDAAGSTGAGGTVTVTVTGNSPLTIGSGGLTVDVANFAGTDGGTVKVTNGGAITADVSSTSINMGSSFASGQGPNLTLSANGVLSVSNVTDIASIGLGTLSLASNSSQAFAIGGAAAGTNGIVDISGLSISASAISIVNGGGGISQNESGPTTSLAGTTSIFLSASGGDIGGNSNQIIIAGTPALILSATSTGPAGATIGGNAYINTTATTAITGAALDASLLVNASGGNLTVGAVGQNPLQFSAGSVTVNYNTSNSSTVTLGSIATTNGSIAVTSSAQNLVVGDGTNAANITAANGNITLLNTNSNAGSNILINAGATIATAGPGGSNVNIVMGAVVPMSPVPGSAPTTNPPTVVENGGMVFFGNNSITTGASDTLTAQGTNVVFDTGAIGAFPATAITLGASVQITADPPVPGATVARSGGNGLTMPAGAMALVNSGNNVLTSGGNLPSGGSYMAGSGNDLSGSGSNLLASGSNLLASGSNLSGSGGNLSGSDGNLLASANTGVISALTASAYVAEAGTASAYSGLFSSLNAANVVSSNGSSDPSGSVAAVTNADGATTMGGCPGVSAGNSNDNCRPPAPTGRISKLPQGSKDRGTHPLTGGVSNTSHRTLDRGPLLLSPEQNEVVDTPLGSVSVAAGSVALIISSEAGLAVYDLHDARKNAVVINCGANTVALTPGRSAVFARPSSNSFEQVNPAPFVTYRQLTSRDVNSLTKLYQAEFDTMSMVRGLPQLNHLMAAPSAKTRKTMSSLLKTAAILTQLCQSNEPYSLYLTPALTAYAAAAQR